MLSASLSGILIGLMCAVSPHPPAVAAAGGYSVRAFGAVGDGEKLDTAAIQKAIDVAAAAGGGTVHFPAGKYLSGTILLRSRVTLYLDTGATILGSTDLNDYPRHSPAYRSYSDNYVNMALIYAEDQHDISIAGHGTIDGQGGHPSFATRGSDPRYGERPFLIRFVTCRNVRVEGITLRDSPMWVQQYLACDNVMLDRLTVLSNVNFNNDMIDIDGCRNVRISNCYGETGDDAITLKSTGPRACEDVTITNCVVSSHCSAIKLGTESTGGFRNIAISNITVRPPRSRDLWNQGYSKGLAGIALLVVDGGVLDGVVISNITIEGTTSPIFMRLGNRARRHADDAPSPGVGTLRNVILSNIVATDTGPVGCAIAGLPGHAIENVTLRDIKVTFPGGGKLEDAARTVPQEAEAYPECTMFGPLPAYGFYIRHARGVTLDNVQVGWAKPDQRPAIGCDDVRDLTISNLQAMLAPGADRLIHLNDVQNAMIRGCIVPGSDRAAFLGLSGSTAGISVIGNDLSGMDHAFRFDGVERRVLFEAANRLSVHPALEE